MVIGTNAEERCVEDEHLGYSATTRAAYDQFIEPPHPDLLRVKDHQPGRIDEIAVAE